MQRRGVMVLCTVCVYMVGKATCRKNVQKFPKVFLNFLPKILIESEVVQTQTEEKRSVYVTTLPLSLLSEETVSPWSFLFRNKLPNDSGSCCPCAWRLEQWESEV